MNGKDKIELTWGEEEEPSPRPERPYAPVEGPGFNRYKRLGVLLICVIIGAILITKMVYVSRLPGQIEELNTKVKTLEGQVAQRDDVIEGLETSLTATVVQVEELTIQVADEQARAEAFKKAAEEASKTVTPQKSTTKATPKTPTPTSYNTAGVDQWRDLVTQWVTHYGGSSVNVEQFLSVMRKESGGNPSAVNSASGCSGLMQIHPCHASKYTSITGQLFYDGRFDPSANIQFAAYMSAGGTNWSSWSAKP